MRFTAILLFLICQLTLAQEKENSVITKDTIHIISIKKIQSKNYKGYKINYTEFIDSNNDLIIPFSYSFNSYNFKEHLLNKKKVSSSSRFLLGAGLGGYLKLYKGIYAGIGLNIPFGYEKYKLEKNINKSRFLIGFESNQGIKFIPWSDFGLTFGINFNQHFINSNLLSREFNYELEIGINF